MKPRLAISLLLLIPSLLRAELTVPHFFSDHMVLQREKPVAIWGRTKPGAEVTVSFKDKAVTAEADADGRWRAEIESGPADATGTALTIRSGEERIEIADVVVGEVWFASGQSNMFFTMNRVPDYEPLIAESTHPGLRFFNAPLVTAAEPQEDIEGAWTAATPETVPGYSAVAFFFARKLHLDLGIPVGVIKSAWGGKPVETFTSREALATFPGTKRMVDAVLEAETSFDSAEAERAFEASLRKWEERATAWRKMPSDQRGRLATKPQPPKRPLLTEGKPGVLFDAMIHPFAGYTMRGAIWYQGEGNARPGAVPYDESLALLIRDWRGRWGDDFSFYFVQLANYRKPSTEPGTPDPWPLLQDRMRRILKTTPKTGMAIINDTGEVDDIHPKNKKDPGERLALWALAKDYGREDLVYSGPLFRSSEARGDAIRVSFDQVGDGLRSREGGELRRFEIAGADRVWHWADAKIAGQDGVLASSPQVPEPVAVRYAWAANPEGANLVNSEGLPASVFRSDDWDDVESGQPGPEAKAQEDRRALALEIQAMKEEREALDSGSAEYRELSGKLRVMLERFRETAPKR